MKQPNTIYGISVSEWAKLDKTGMRAVKQRYEADIRERNLAASRALAAKLDAEHAERVAERQAAQDQQAHEQTVRDLQRGYFAADPTATEDDFQKALPALLEQHRQQSALRQRNATHNAVRRRIARAF